ncbi:ph-response sensor protein [Paraconiothyrium brasiliense]|uniref:Ph-response sensor protein n=1 Tax=Paraconiothyrium brasiliense TaxID=300254 RepID=A0ABR3QU53_9PLEO
MTSSPTVTSSPSVSGRSLLSRLRAPLKSKTRNSTEFHIQPDDPHRQYAPGDIISGSVIVKVIKPLRITHLVISLHGYAQVYKNPNSPGDAYKNYSSTVGSGKGKKTGSYFGNGFVSLFEDEAVLCGEGRLGEGVYHFNFELEFPSKGLPSSIDFERGTISYMLTASLTKPTTISPVSSCDTKVHFMDIIDIASVPEPKPRAISLEPISRRGRARTPKKLPQVQEATLQVPEDVGPTRSARASDSNLGVEEADHPGSPAPSDTSFESQMSSGNASGTEYGIRSVNTHLDSTLSNANQTSVKGKTITATIEVSKGGFLRGDNINLKISVNHTKHVRSLKGIIVTLYRQARVDMHPALPVLANSKNDKAKSEDYYPKSRTGLGGLSLSSAGSSHLFRKDLSQSFAPLFVDPRTLTAEVKCAVRVPDEAFPSISNVPGAMISFKYFVEVVVDIQGKLSGLDRILPTAGLVPISSNSAMGGLGPEDANGSMFSTWGGNFADTDSIRREKGVVSSLFEVVIGTKDSERNGKRKVQPVDARPDVQEIPLELTPSVGGEQDPDYYGYDHDGQYYDHYAYDGAYGEAPGYHDGSSSQAPYIPQPENEEGLSEKERIRRAEARLLPSQPPGDGGSSASPAVPSGIPPSAPVLDDDDDTQPAYYPTESSAAASGSSSHPPPSFSAATAPAAPRSLPRTSADDDTRTATTGSSLTINANTVHPAPPANTVQDATKALPALPPPSPSPVTAPEYSSSSSAHVQPTDDKQELQRRRLQMEASAPPTNPEETSSSLGLAPPADGMHNLTLAPSAPMLDDDDEGLVSAVRPGRSRGRSEAPGGDELPEYQG